MLELMVALLFVLSILIFILTVYMNERIDSLFELYKLTRDLIDLLELKLDDKIKYVDDKIDIIDKYNDKAHSNFIEMIQSLWGNKK